MTIMLPSSARRMSTNRYKDEQVTLTSDHAEWTELTFSLRDGETQIVDYNGLADSRDHEAQFSFEIVKSGNEFNFKNHHMDSIGLTYLEAVVVGNLMSLK